MTPTLQSKLPVLPIAAMAALVLSSLVGVSIVRLAGVSPVQQVDATTISMRLLRFQDRDDGAIEVIDANNGALLDTVAPGSNGFLRSTMRGLVRERKRQSLGPETPFELLGRADGRLTLIDPGTGRRIDLESFGASNSAVFAKLLPATTSMTGVEHHVTQR